MAIGHRSSPATNAQEVLALRPTQSSTSTSRLSGITRAALVGALIWVGLAATGAAAYAFREEHECGDLPANTRCYTGGGYHQFLDVRSQLQHSWDTGYVSPQLCAKAVNAYNEVRTGSACANDASFVRACFPGANTYSRAYGSHNGKASTTA